MSKYRQTLQPGKILRLSIHGLSHAGEGVARTEEMVIFVPGALPGEEIEAQVSQVKKNYARGKVTAILNPSINRVKPICPAYNGCGGCHLQHLDYKEHLRHKTEVVQTALRRIGNIKEAVVHNTIGMGDPWHYRNKVHLQIVRKGQDVKLGFFQEGSHELAYETEENDCLLVDTGINKVIITLSELLNRYNVSVYDWTKKQGLLRNLMIRRGKSSGEIMVVLVTTGDKWAEEAKFVKDLVERHSNIVSVIRNINDDHGRVILGKENRVLAGRDHIVDILGGLKFKVSASSFYQVNPIQTEVLYKKALDYAELKGTEKVVDAYCGIGTIALYFARHVKHVTGIEVIPEAVEDARANAAYNKISNADFLQGQVEKVLPGLLAQDNSPDVLILDPPRQGCDPQVLKSIAEIGIHRVVYVSCDPATLARDLSVLSQLDYRVVEVQPVDMFPWTAHVEVVAQMYFNGER